MKLLSKREWAVLAFIAVYSFIPAFGGLLRVLELAGGPAIVPSNPRALAAPLPIVLHVVSSFLFCIVGALQFLPSLRRRAPTAHRALGRVIAVAGCVSAASGLWMTHCFVFPEDLQGHLLYWVRIGLGASMIGLIVWGVIAIRSRNVFQHGASMLRAYAIGQGASTQAMLGIGWVLFFGTEPLGPLRDGLMVSAWGLNLVVAQVLIGRLPAPKSSHRRGGGVEAISPARRKPPSAARGARCSSPKTARLITNASSRRSVRRGGRVSSSCRTMESPMSKALVSRDLAANDLVSRDLVANDLVAVLSIGRTFRTLFWLGQSLKSGAASQSDTSEWCR